MARTEKQSMVVEDVKLERVRVTFPTGLTVPQALRAGMLIGGAEFVASPQLRLLAEDRLGELGVEAKCIYKRGRCKILS
jgi:hypothetical protein